ncbi:MAG: hypothetical protein JO369_04185 [Paucibacter sp.]|nr:hypothetical protein [Roseateles sp.]
MRVEQVEIYSDVSNAVVLRHPGRRYPGCLIQGDSLHALVQSLRSVQREATCLSEDATDALSDATGRLTELLDHYRHVMAKHGLDLPFNDAGSF